MAPTALLAALAALGGLATLGWLGVLLVPARPWSLRPIAEDEDPPPEPPAWPGVVVLVPARNEAAYLPLTLPALLGQDYRGEWQVIVVDDRSSDGTDEVARRLGGQTGRLSVVAGAALPEGWAGKVWALEQGVRSAPTDARYLLLTDADIRHAPSSLSRLVAEAEAGNLALVSRMARLRCQSAGERLLIPPFLFFFNLLYPMRLVNAPRSRVAAAAGGCVLVRRDVLERAGGLTSIRSQVIDDVNLAGRIKGVGEPIRLALSRSDVESLREYSSAGAVWRMVRRTAFDELRHSLALLAGALAGLALLFPLAPLLALTGVALALAGAASWAWCGGLGGIGVVGWTLAAAAFRPTVRYFGLPGRWAWTLPLAGTLYGGMTLDSARRYLAERRRDW